MSAGNVINHLINTAHDLGPEGRDDRYGYGEVDPLTALTAEVAEVTANPLSTGPRAGGGAAGGALVDAAAEDTSGGGDSVHELAKGAVSTSPFAQRQAAAASAGHRLAPALFLAGLVGAAIIGASLNRRRYAQRYLRRARHAR